MKTSELDKKLVGVYDKLGNSFYSKGFVSRDILESIQNELGEIIDEIKEDGIQVESYIENKIQFCGSCRQKVSLRRKRIDKTTVSALIKAFNFVMKHKRQTFQIQELNLSGVQYGVLNHLVRFGLLYKNESFARGEYGVPRRTVSKFLKGEWKVAEYFETDPTKREGEEGRRFMSEKRIGIDEVPSVSELRDEFGEKLVEYEWNEDFE